MTEDRLISTFLDLVRIDSPSRSEAGVAAYCIDALRASGFDVRTDDSSEVTGSNTGNVIAVLSATGPGSTLLLSAHMDCVQPCVGVEPVISDGTVRSAGATVLGGDDKAGIAAIIEAVRRLTESGETHGEVKVVLTVAEEVGLTGAKALDQAEVTADICLVLDADGEAGGIVIGAPTHYTFVATFHGRAAHAGVEPEQGISALVMASKAISAMSLGRLDDATTANIGSLNGGTATNVVPAQAIMTGECRSRDTARVEEVRATMDTIMRQAAHAQGGTVDVVWTREYSGFSFSHDDPVVTLVADACHDVGLTPRTFTTGGGSDGNIFSATAPTLVLSCGMTDVHSTSESLRLTDLLALTDLILAVARRCTKG